MAASRKLQGEIDRCLKKVSEGVEIFEDIWQKVHNATNTNQKEKSEADLKKEIKKLQRLRDQIKVWIASPEVKDKSALIDARKLIETQMERFKVVERETKTKAYSKEGLGAATKLDPTTREREELNQWLCNAIDQLQIQLDQFDAEIELIMAGKKKKLDKDKQERFEQLKVFVEKHKFHLGKLEALLRMLDNLSVDGGEVEKLREFLSQVRKIKDDIDYYLESHQEPEYEENEFIYDDIEGLEEQQLQLAAAAALGLGDDSDDEDKPVTAVTVGSPSTSAVTTMATNSAPNTPKLQTGSPLKQMSVESPVSIPIESPVAMETPPPAPATVVIEQPKPIAVVPKPTEPAPVEPISPPKQAVVIMETEQEPIQPVTMDTVQIDNESLMENGGALAPEANEATSNQIIGSLKTMAQDVLEREGLILGNKSEQELASITTATSSPPTASTQFSSIQQPNSPVTIETATTTAHIPPLLGVAPLGPYPLQKEHQLQLQMLEAAAAHMPLGADSERMRQYLPRNPVQTPSYYPQQPLTNTDSIDFFQRLSIETLFFIFYYLEGSKAQYLAAKVLKKQSWRFHTKYMMWFQRHEEPKVINEEYEQGTYIYFDIEKWGQRKKDGFVFEYRYLEDRDLN